MMLIMKKSKLIILLFFLSELMFGCSYYGTNTYLSSETNDKIVCEGVSIFEIWPTLINKEKSAHAFAGIPYFSALADSKPLELGKMHIIYEHVRDIGACKTSDLILVTTDNEIIFKPISIWQSKTIEKNEINYTRCTYKFVEIDQSKDYNLHFESDYLNCNNHKISLKKEQKKGYYRVLVQ